MADHDRQHDQWWERGPVFSTTDRGSKITTIAPGAAVGTLTPGIAVGAVLLAAVWTGLVYLGFPRILGDGYAAPGTVERAESWWWLALLAVTVVVALFVTPSFYGPVASHFGRQSAGSGLTVVAVAAGFAAAGLLHLRELGAYRDALPPDTPSWEVPDATIILILTGSALLVTLGGLLWLPLGYSRARRRQAQILRLRATGRVFTGEVDAVDFKHQWIGGRPQFAVTVRYALGDGTRTFAAAMTSESDRVPLPGFPVRIMVGDRGETLVEPDLDRPAAFDTAGDYSQPTGGG